MKIEPFVHRCVVRHGPAAGNKNWVEVSAYDIEYQTDCEECGSALARPEEVIAHIYSELTK